MKILFVHRNLPPDTFTGVAVQVDRLAHTLCQKGHQVTICTQSQKPVNAPYQVIPWGATPFQNKGIWKSAKIFKRFLAPLFLERQNFKEYDIVHIHGDGGFIRYQKNYVRTFYGTARKELEFSPDLKGKIAQALSFFFEKKESEQLAETGCAVAISGHVSRYLSAVKTVIPTMISENYVQAKSDKKSPEPTLYFIGSAGSRKRGELALNIFIHLKKAIPGMKFYYISKNLASDKTFFQQSVPGKNEGPLFLENLSEQKLIDIVESCWMYLSLSSYEGFGVGVIEAMSAGTIPISTPNFGSEGIIRDKVNGRLVPDFGIIPAILEIVEKPAMRRQMSSAARETSKQYFPEAVAMQYLQVYEKLLA